MSEQTKTYVFGNEGQNTFDPNLLLGMMFGNGGFGGFGGGANWIWPLFLFALWGGNGFGGWGGNGNGGFGPGRGVGFLSNQISEDTGRQLVMNAISGVDSAVGQLASALNCSVGDIQNALCAIQGKISDVGNQVGMTAMQVVNAIDRGDAALASQLAQCCCDLKGAIKDVAIGQERGFSSLANAQLQQTCSIEKAIAGSTSVLTARLDAMEKSQLYDKIDKLREEKGTLTTQLNLEHQTNAIMQSQAQMLAPVNAALNDLSKRLADIECNQPPVAKIPYVPAAGNYVPVNYSVPVNFGVSTLNGCGYGCNY